MNLLDCVRDCKGFGGSARVTGDFFLFGDESGRLCLGFEGLEG